MTLRILPFEASLNQLNDTSSMLDTKCRLTNRCSSLGFLGQMAFESNIVSLYLVVDGREV